MLYGDLLLPKPMIDELMAIEKDGYQVTQRNAKLFEWRLYYKHRLLFEAYSTDISKKPLVMKDMILVARIHAGLNKGQSVPYIAKTLNRTEDDVNKFIAMMRTVIANTLERRNRNVQ